MGAVTTASTSSALARSIALKTYSPPARPATAEAEPPPHMACGPLQNIPIADAERDDLPVDRLLSEGLQDDLWPDPGRIAHRNPYAPLASLTLHPTLLPGSLYN